MKRIALALLLAAVLPLQANAGDSSTVLYMAGRYEEAIKAGLAENDGRGFVMAARAALADATMRDRPCLACLKRAEGFARRATNANPRLPEGHIYLAVSLGYQARIVGPVVARLHNYPGEAKRELDAALARDPKNAWALAALGGWNVEIVRTGGAAMANWFYGATVDAGLEHFAAAFKSDPNNIALRFQYALSLSGYDLARFRGEVHDALSRAARTAPNTAYDRLARARAVELLDLLKRNDLSAYAARVRRYQGYP